MKRFCAPADLSCPVTETSVKLSQVEMGLCSIVYTYAEAMRILETIDRLDITPTRMILEFDIA